MLLLLTLRRACSWQVFRVLKQVDGSLDPFQIVSRLKVFTTAIFSILLLDWRLASVRWLSLAVLSAGVILVQMQQGSSKKSSTEMNPLIGTFKKYLMSL